MGYAMLCYAMLWQAMGRCRTMNDTSFRIYISDPPADAGADADGTPDIKAHALTRTLYAQ